jgi:membrane protease YdiL (CAAX protease family)
MTTLVMILSFLGDLLDWLVWFIKWLFIVFLALTWLVEIIVLFVSRTVRKEIADIYKHLIRQLSFKTVGWAILDVAGRLSVIIILGQWAQEYKLIFMNTPFYSWGTYFKKTIGSVFASVLEGVAIFKDHSTLLMTLAYILLMLLMPLMAFFEEDIFRGYESRRGRIISSVIFGYVHLLVNYTFLVCSILIVSGYFYTYLYALRKKKVLAVLNTGDAEYIKHFFRNAYGRQTRLTDEQLDNECKYYTGAVHAVGNMILATAFFIYLLQT